PLIVLAYHADPTLVGLSSSVRMAPWFIFSVISGIYIDRISKKYIVVSANLLRGLTFLALGMFYYYSDGSIYVLLPALFFIGICEVFSDNAIPAMLPDLVEDKYLEKANYWVSQAEISGNQFIGPSLGGLIASVSNILALHINGLLYIISAFLFKDCVSDHVNTKPEKFSFAKLVQPFQSDKNLILLAIIAFSWNTAFSADLINALFFIQDELKLSASYYGLTIALSAIGAAIFGNLLVSYFAQYNLKAKIIIIGVSYLISMLVRGMSDSVFIFLSSFVIIGTAELLLNVTSITYRQRAVNRTELAKVNSLIRMIALSGFMLGPIIGGYLCEEFGARTTQYLLMFCLVPIFIILPMITHNKLSLAMTSGERSVE
ncbi:MFS transporter, partial [Photobacterium damselae]|uniref:MFS transporter n=1 Tax=Photobacterium damselae TaxID=38293 RepID=UPI002F414075